MKIQIYQSYYAEHHIDHLDIEFTPFNNRDSKTWFLNEQPIQVKCYNVERTAKNDLWGVFSWAWKKNNKFVGLQSTDILNQITNNPGNDVYLFNPVGWLETICYNVWEQGESCHKGIINLAREIFYLMEIDPDLVFQPMDCTNICWGSYYVGNDKFWKEWIEFGNKYVNSIPKLSPKRKQLHSSSANYKGFDYFPFIYERLFSTFLLINKGKFNVYYYQHNCSPLEDPLLRNLKLQAITEKDLSKLNQWNEQSLDKLSKLDPSRPEHLSIKYKTRKQVADYFIKTLKDWK